MNPKGGGGCWASETQLCLVPVPTPTSLSFADSHRPGNNRSMNAMEDMLALAAVPTPRAEDSEQTGAHRGNPDTLNSMSKLIPVSTPGNRESEGGDYADPEKAALRRQQGHQINLSDTVMQVATPNLVDAKGGNRLGKGQNQLCHQIHGVITPSSPCATAARYALNAAYSRWLMAYPATWDHCSPGWESWALIQRVLTESFGRLDATE
jgi:hypothetical protein